MQEIILCDDCQLPEVATLASVGNWGIEVQAFYDPDLIQREPDIITTYRDNISKIEPKSLHGPFADLCPGSIDSMVRDVAKNRCEMALEFAQELDATHLVLHHGYVPGTSGFDGWLFRSSNLHSYCDDES